MFRSKMTDVSSKEAEQAITKLGAEFARLRAKRGERLEDIAEYLGIRSTYLYGIERGDVSIIASRRSLRSCIANYANYLGLDGDGVAGRVLPMIGGLEGAKAPPGFWGFAGADRNAAIILAASIILGIVAGWWYLGDTTKLDLIASPVTAEAGYDTDYIEESDQAIAEAAEESPEEAAESLAIKAEQALANLEVQNIEGLGENTDPFSVDDEPPADGDLALDQAAIGQDEQAEGAPSIREERPANVLATLLTKDVEIYETQNTDARVIIRALATSWVQVSSTDRSYIWTRTMQPREMLLVPNRDDLELWAGDASGVEILLDGIVLPSLGPAGTVVRGVSLAPPSLEALSATVSLEAGAKPTF